MIPLDWAIRLSQKKSRLKPESKTLLIRRQIDIPLSPSTLEENCYQVLSGISTEQACSRNFMSKRKISSHGYRTNRMAIAIILQSITVTIPRNQLMNYILSVENTAIRLNLKERRTYYRISNSLHFRAEDLSSSIHSMRNIAIFPLCRHDMRGITIKVNVQRGKDVTLN